MNFGHTFAHAIEMSLEGGKKEVIRHGEAVGIGMLCEIFYNENYINNYKKVHELLSLYKLPTNLNFLRINRREKLLNNIFNNIFR